MNLKKAQIRSYCSFDVYRRGYHIWENHLILDLTAEDISPTEVHLEGNVRGHSRSSYDVNITLKATSNEKTGNDEVEFASCSCTCPAFSSYYGICKHCVAVCLEYSEQQKTDQILQRNFFRSTRQTHSSDKMLAVLSHYSAPEETGNPVAPGSLHLELSFYDSNGNFSIRQPYGVSVQARAGLDKLYVIKNFPQFLFTVMHGTLYTYGKKLSVIHSLEVFDERSQQMLQALISAARRAFPFLDNPYQGALLATISQRALSLQPEEINTLIALQAQPTGLVELNEHFFTYKEGNPPVNLTFTSANQGMEIVCTSLERLSAEPYGLYYNAKTIYHTTPDFQRHALPFLHAIGASSTLEPITTFLAEEDFQRFCADVLPHLRKYLRIHENEVDLDAYMPVEPDFRFSLSATKEGGIHLRPEVCYGASVYPLETSGTEYRNRAKETPVIQLVQTYFPDVVPGDGRSVSGEDALYTLLQEGLEKLREVGEVLIDASLQTFRWATAPQTGIAVTLEGGLIDIQVQAQGYSVKEINEILQAYRFRKRYVRLKNGEFLSLEDGSLSVVAALSEGLDQKLDSTGHIQTEAFRAQYINRVLDHESADLSVRRSTSFKQQIRALNEYRDSDYEVPEGLQATLRAYQRTGFRWLSTLSDCGLGGILADDMGLGKTVQMLAYFLHIGGSVLVVCPASLLYNWESECRRFAPQITPHLVRGTPAQRKQTLTAQEGLFITSYEQLRRDLSLYSERTFDCCVLDEAQFIRNAATKAAKAVKQINAKHRFALTGTPIENRLSDLWSIFDFLMPGYLHSYTEFRRSIEQPAVDGDQEATTQLNMLVSPFILRRKKQEVLSELPDKIEEVLCVDMTPEQQKLYLAQEDALRHTLQNTSESEFLHQKLTYLSALTRLRQICCTPSLFLENYEGGSGKIAACMELLQDSAESGHRTLVFSQFTSMLELLIAQCQAANLPCLYLSGKNSSEERRDMVATFQEGNTPIFFISLKAGGTGLNLTAADRVIHFDPWWNAAAEDQATDRTHRIGQKNTVLVTRLVCKNTVEERILDLQQKKRELSNLAMDSERIRQGSFDRDEILALLTQQE